MIQSKIFFRTAISLCLLLALSLGATAQTGINPTGEKPQGGNDTEKDKPAHKSNTLIYVGAGYNFLGSNVKSQAYLNNAADINLSIYQPFLVRKLFTFGIQGAAEYGFSTMSNFGALPAPFHVTGETSSTVAFNSSAGNIKQSAFKIEAGPQLNIHLGNHFVISPAFMVGALILTQSEFSADQATIMPRVLGPQTYNYTLFSKLDITAGALAVTPKLRVHYLINDWIGVWAEVNYTIAPTIKTYLSRFTPQDTPDSTGRYDQFQLDHGTTTTEQRKVQFTSVGLNGGLVFSFGKKRNPNRPVGADEAMGVNEQPIPDKPKGTKSKGGSQSPAHGGHGDTKAEIVQSEESQQGDKKHKEQNCIPVITYPISDATLNPKGNNHINVTFPASYTGEKNVRIYKLSDDANYLNTLKPEEKARMISGIESISEIEIEGKKKYILTMTKTGMPDEYTTSLDNTATSEGTYIVYAGSQGCRSNSMVYKSMSCTPATSTTLDSAKCQPNGTIKVWGHISITTPPGGPSLTGITTPYLINTTDNISPVALASLNPQPLSTAVGVDTFSFIAPANLSCKKIKLVFNINFTNCIGSISSYPCANDTSFQMPCCVCRDCDSTTLTFHSFTETHSANNANHYNLAGSLSSNRPVYGLEFQVLSYNFTDVPSACGDGVSSIEQSGMFLMPTTINGHIAGIFNVSTQGANNFASKDVELLSTTPMTGNIPVNLLIGLPGPLPGLAPGCCHITYNVCISVKVFYEPNSCKSCTFNKCFSFTN